MTDQARPAPRIGLLPLALAIALAAGCGSGDRQPKEAAAQPAGPPPTSVVVGQVIQQPIRGDLRTIGTVEPIRTTTVSAEVGGLVEAFPLREGDRVARETSVIAQLKRTDREIALREASAAVAKAKAEWEKLQSGYRSEEVNQRRAEVRERRALLEQAENDLARAKELHADRAISLQQLQREEASFLAARAQHEKALEALQEAESGYRQEDVAKAEAEYWQARAIQDRIRHDLERTTIRSPMTGYLVKKHLEVGQWVDEGGKVADLVDLDTVEVVTLISEKDIGRIRVGDAATLRVDAYPGRTFTGRIAHLVPQADLQSRAFPVKIQVANPEGHPLKGGMLARVTIEYGAPRPAILVPKDAVVRRGDREIVFVVTDQTVLQREVSTGRAVGGYLEIVQGGLAPGDAIVVTGNEALRDGAPVQVVPPRQPNAPRPPAGGRSDGR